MSNHAGCTTPDQIAFVVSSAIRGHSLGMITVRVSIRTEEFLVRDGWFRRSTRYRVLVDIQFSQEELAIIRHRRLEDVVVMERPHPFTSTPELINQYPHLFNLTIGDLIAQHPSAYALETPLEAKGYEYRLTECLAELKEFLDRNAGIDPRRKVFEL